MKATLVFTKQGAAVRVRSGPDGAYRVSLMPGRYRVSAYPRIAVSPPRVRPGLVNVRAGHVDELDFTISFGIP